MVLVKAADSVKGEVWMETAVPFREIWGVVVCFMPTCSPQQTQTTRCAQTRPLLSYRRPNLYISPHLSLYNSVHSLAVTDPLSVSFCVCLLFVFSSVFYSYQRASYAYGSSLEEFKDGLQLNRLSLYCL